MIRLISIVLFLSISTASIVGQWRGPIIEKFGSNEGLDGWIRDMAQDSLGYIYFATDQGLYQYDGETFHLYKHNPQDPNSISPGHLNQLLVSSDGLVWMTPHQSPLNSFDPQTGHFTEYEYPDHGLDDELNGASSICEGEEGDIWLGSFHYDLLQLDRKTGKMQRHVPEWIEDSPAIRRANFMTGILQDRKDPDIIWLTCHRDAGEEMQNKYYGLMTFNKVSKSFEWHPCNINIEHQDESGKLWGYVWSSPIKSYDPKTRTCDTISISLLYPDDDEWLGPISFSLIPNGDGFLLANRAVVDYEPGKEPRTHFQLDDERSFKSLLIDRQQNLWMGHYEGVYVQAKKNQHIRFFSLSMFGIDDDQYPGRMAYDPITESILYPDLASNPKGQKIYQIPASKTTSKTAKALNVEFYVSGIAVDESNNTWIAGNGSFHQYDRNTQKVIPETSEAMMPGTIPWVWNIRTSNQGWIGAAGVKEFMWFDPRKKELKRTSIKEFDNYTDLWDIEGFTFSPNDKAIIWAYTQIIEVDLLTGKSRIIEWPAAMIEDIDLVQYVEWREDGKLWVSFFTEIFNFRYDNSILELLDRFTASDGLTAPTMSEMHFDHLGRIWLFSGIGMDCLNPETREVRHFSVKDGLPTPSVGVTKQTINISDDRIASVCRNGIIVFHPDSLWNSSSRQNLPIVIQEVRVNGKSFARDTLIDDIEKYHLPVGQQVVDVKFQALSFPTNRKVKYSYRINEGEWIGIDNNNFVTLPDLSYGNTKLEIRTGDGETPVEIKQILFEKATPLRARWWFLPATLLAAGLIVFILYRNRVKQIQRREEEKTETNKKFAELELTALRSQMNPHFMFNSLNSIKTYILEAQPDMAAEYLSQFAHLIRRILQNSREKLISLKEEIETLNLYISLEQFRFENAFELCQEVDANIDLNEVMIPPMILQPFIENAIWHGLMQKEGKGLLILRFELTDEFVYCIVEDDGVGREKARSIKSLSAQRHKSMGMGITQNRVQLLNQMDTYGMSIEIFDKKDLDGKANGTKVIVKIPLHFGEE